ncbi:MAG TPA: cytochrome c oxidase subunit 3 [Steroidobacteraceae bacterium]|nr:cytochrome c oxidase subunit 3 [Steroidobacteraceae bacterium]
MSSEAFPVQPPLPMGSIGRMASGTWGVVFLVISESMIFAYLAFGYFYFSSQPHYGPWPPDGPPSWFYPGWETAVAFAGSLSVWWANRAVARGDRAGLLSGLAVSLLLSLGFVALQGLDWYHQPTGFATDPYSSFYYLITGFHLAHVVVGVIMFAVVLLWSGLGYFGPVRHTPVKVAKIYWYFVTIVWLIVLFTLDVTPYFGWKPYQVH